MLVAVAVLGWGLHEVAGSDVQGAEGGRIAEIRFEGNKRTHPTTLLQEMRVRVGDSVDLEAVERSRQAIMDLELFKLVGAELLPGPDGQILVIRVEEKHFYFVLPIISRNGDGDVTVGAQARFENLWGRNHRFKFEARHREFGSNADVDDEKGLELAYRFPRIGGGPWELDSKLRFREALLNEDRNGLRGEYERITTLMRLEASRWKRPGPSRGWRFGTGVSHEDFEFEFIEGDPTLFFDTTEVGLLGLVEYVDVRSFEYNRSGRSFTYELQVFPEALGSATDRRIHFVRFRRFRPVTRRRFTNLNIQLRAGLATESLFGDPEFNLTGSTRLRGYERESIEGDAYILANVEFISPLSRLDKLRGVLFVDVGDAFPSLEDTSLADLKASLGVGLRWKLRSFVKVDLRLDVGYGFDRDSGGETKLYAGSEATF